MTPKFPQDGHCACRAVHYRLLEDLVELHACHCTKCQRVTGGAFLLSASVRREAVERVSGELIRFEYPTEGGNKIDYRCAACASFLWSESLRFPDLYSLRTATLDDQRWLTPTAHIWLRSKQPWVLVPEDSTHYEGQPEGEEMLDMVRAWKARPGAPV